MDKNKRKAVIKRDTFETKILIEMNLDKFEMCEVKTGSGFIDHMLDLFQVHSKTSLKVLCDGDTHIDLIYGEDVHHAIESIFKAFARALRIAISIDPDFDLIPSSKGYLE